MEPISVIRASAMPLPRADVDTDQIIPSDWLKRVERTGFGAGLFAEWREDPDFVLNDPRYSGAQILVAGSNFGVGSSREHAVWALQDYGFKAIVSPRFGDIFRNNCTKVGIVPVVVKSEVAERLFSAIARNPKTEIVVDVANLRITSKDAGVDEPFELDEFTQYRFLNGLDDIGLTMLHGQAIDDFEAGRPGFMPSLTRR
jgi:3-isopropylmalate/(R)-2-methylmalate dehydratase small subunit